MSTTTMTAGSLTGAATTTRKRWPVFGAAAGLAGFVTNAMLTPWASEASKQAGPDAVFESIADQRIPFHLGQSVGWLATFLLVGFTVGYVAHLRSRATEQPLLVSATSLGLAGSFGAMIVFYGMKSMLAGGLPGSIDAAIYTKTDVAVLELLVGQGQWISWMGVVVAAGCTALLALKFRILPRWLGIVSALFAVVPAGMAVILGLPYAAGITGPLWLVAVSIGARKAA